MNTLTVDGYSAIYASSEIDGDIVKLMTNSDFRAVLSAIKDLHCYAIANEYNIEKIRADAFWKQVQKDFPFLTEMEQRRYMQMHYVPRFDYAYSASTYDLVNRSV